MLYGDLTDKIIKCFYQVYNTLGYGFLEKVYERSMMIECVKIGLHGVSQKKIDVYYDSQVVGDYFADIIINDCVILEIKAGEGLRDEHKAQLINYLKATDKEVGLLFNFGKSPEFKRVIFSNDRKKR